ncbi:hypothetical protein RF11_12975 [Thelohanellus kitauei]|uniref:Uncharacterized protein n=1 Tax=Thelohanellus kitauei TaxID=669202 RepID=A0A0C2J2Y7_THEKT|nr:hypothetical protein RF11_12975 [Thelohanellus kitauei]
MKIEICVNPTRDRADRKVVKQRRQRVTLGTLALNPNKKADGWSPVTGIHDRMDLSALEPVKERGYLRHEITTFLEKEEGPTSHTPYQRGAVGVTRLNVVAVDPHSGGSSWVSGLMPANKGLFNVMSASDAGMDDNRTAYSATTSAVSLETGPGDNCLAIKLFMSLINMELLALASDILFSWAKEASKPTLPGLGSRVASGRPSGHKTWSGSK